MSIPVATMEVEENQQHTVASGRTQGDRQSITTASVTAPADAVTPSLLVSESQSLPILRERIGQLLQYSRPLSLGALVRLVPSATDLLNAHLIHIKRRVQHRQRRMQKQELQRQEEKGELLEPKRLLAKGAAAVVASVESLPSLAIAENAAFSDTAAVTQENGGGEVGKRYGNGASSGDTSPVTHRPGPAAAGAAATGKKGSSASVRCAPTVAAASAETTRGGAHADGVLHREESLALSSPGYSVRTLLSVASPVSAKNHFPVSLSAAIPATAVASATTTEWTPLSVKQSSGDSGSFTSLSAKSASVTVNELGGVVSDEEANDTLLSKPLLAADAAISKSLSNEEVSRRLSLLMQRFHAYQLCELLHEQAERLGYLTYQDPTNNDIIATAAALRARESVARQYVDAVLARLRAMPASQQQHGQLRQEQAGHGESNDSLPFARPWSEEELAALDKHIMSVLGCNHGKERHCPHQGRREEINEEKRLRRMKRHRREARRLARAQATERRERKEQKKWQRRRNQGGLERDPNEVPEADQTSSPALIGNGAAVSSHRDRRKRRHNHRQPLQEHHQQNRRKITAEELAVLLGAISAAQLTPQPGATSTTTLGAMGAPGGDRMRRRDSSSSALCAQREHQNDRRPSDCFYGGGANVTLIKPPSAHPPPSQHGEVGEGVPRDRSSSLDAITHSLDALNGLETPFPPPRPLDKNTEGKKNRPRRKRRQSSVQQKQEREEAHREEAASAVKKSAALADSLSSSSLSDMASITSTDTSSEQAFSSLLSEDTDSISASGSETPFSATGVIESPGGTGLGQPVHTSGTESVGNADEGPENEDTLSTTTSPLIRIAIPTDAEALVSGVTSLPASLPSARTTMSVTSAAMQRSPLLNVKATESTRRHPQRKHDSVNENVERVKAQKRNVDRQPALSTPGGQQESSDTQAFQRPPTPRAAATSAAAATIRTCGSAEHDIVVNTFVTANPLLDGYTASKPFTLHELSVDAANCIIALPRYAQSSQMNYEANRRGRTCYRDPLHGVLVLSSSYLARFPHCFGEYCTHCPHGDVCWRRNAMFSYTREISSSSSSSSHSSAASSASSSLNASMASAVGEGGPSRTASPWSRRCRSSSSSGSSLSSSSSSTSYLGESDRSDDGDIEPWSLALDPALAPSADSSTAPALSSLTASHARGNARSQRDSDPLGRGSFGGLRRRSGGAAPVGHTAVYYAGQWSVGSAGVIVNANSIEDILRWELKKPLQRVARQQRRRTARHRDGAVSVGEGDSDEAVARATVAISTTSSSSSSSSDEADNGDGFTTDTAAAAGAAGEPGQSQRNRKGNADETPSVIRRVASLEKFSYLDFAGL